jgi:hypothetical protein
LCSARVAFCTRELPASCSDEDGDDDHEVAEAAKWIAALADTQLADKFSDKWDAARRAFKGWKGHADKSGAARAKKKRVLEISSVFFEWCGTQPDLSMPGLTVRLQLGSHTCRN